MANGMYTPSKKLLLDADIDLLVATIKADLVDAADYTRDLTNHDFYNDLAGVEETATLGSKTTTAGTFDSADVTWTAAAGDPCEQVVLWCDTAGASTTDPLIVNYDTFASGMPVTPNGGDITLTVNASGWFSI